MKITKQVTTYVELNLYVRFESGSIPDALYYSHTFRPEVLHVTVGTANNGDGWSVGGIVVSGPKILKSGKLSTGVMLDQRFFGTKSLREEFPGMAEWIDAKIRDLNAVDLVPLAGTRP